jgi:hypothetical protein
MKESIETGQQQVVTIGGEDWMPLYSRFYLTAAQTLITVSGDNVLSDVALPILYVQRHCLELVIKDLILGCFHLAEALNAAGTERIEVNPPPWDHDLLALVDVLQRALLGVKFRPDQELSAILQLAKQLAALERGSPERFRYVSVEPFRKQRRAPPTGFPNVCLADLGGLQRDLANVYLICADIENRVSLWRRLYDAAGTSMANAMNEDAAVAHANADCRAEHSREEASTVAPNLSCQGKDVHYDQCNCHTSGSPKQRR